MSADGSPTCKIAGGHRPPLQRLFDKGGSNLTEWHVITGEYPPQAGGVSDYTRLVASGLAAAGDAVHVWCPPCAGSDLEDSGVFVHRELGAMTPYDLLRVGRMLDKFPKPRRILVQWVPHAFGFRSANLPLSLWLWNRAFAHKDHIEIMLHEPYLPMRQDRLRHSALAVVHRMMLAAVLRAANRVWTAIPKWEEYCRPYTFGKPIPFTWLPVVSNIPVDHQSGATQAVRARYAPSDGCLIGHFGTCGGAIGDALRALLPALLDQPKRAVLLIGQDSQHARDELLKDYPLLGDKIHATGPLSPEEVSWHISACDMMLQPYPDGVSSRRGSLMATLSHGKPIVATSGRLTEPLWHECGPVVLVPAGNHDQMIAVTENLLADPGRRESLGAAAKIMYDKGFGLQNLIGLLRNEANRGNPVDKLEGIRIAGQDAATPQQSS